MPTAHSIFTRSYRGLDRRVWLTMIIVMAASLLLLGFKLATHSGCSSVELLIRGYTSGKGPSYYLGETISFSIKDGKKQKVTWDFGDHTPVKQGLTTTHTYSNEGSYLVVATIDGRCTQMTTIRIRQFTDHTVPVSQPVIDNPIEGTETPTAGTPTNYSTTVTAGSYEWSVLNSPDFPVQSGSVATYTFTAPGTRIIELKLDGDPSRVYRKTLQVLPGARASNPADQEYVPPPAAPTPVMEERKEEAPKEKEGPKFLVIPDEEFRSMLDQVTDGKKDLQSFSAFLCSGDQTKVLANGNEWMTLASLCAKIYDHKKYAIKSVTTVRDEKNCVTILKVNYKKKGLF
jgi:hypothetical protein